MPGLWRVGFEKDSSVSKSVVDNRVTVKTELAKETANPRYGQEMPESKPQQAFFNANQNFDQGTNIIPPDSVS